ncbi:putative MFS family arabinose efflux permease [Shimia isoporae]|uniref:Putative MFS family arabinose efflux permease n=1 Tax=Shimia isoporae TaxID=647720 RepID=A0A4R1NL96_9RHOB|nr:MFS transporter [Shimia isoporae]TCL09024.1 putative MFS family arabinose efflux permease [Shimia isoporae]
MKAVWILMCAIGVVGANSLVLSPIATEVATAFAGRDAADVMLASAVYGAGTALSALFLAPQADRIGLKRALLWALSILAAALLLSASAPSLTILIVAQGITGIGAGLALPAIYGLAADVSPKGQESATLGKVLTGWTLSLVAGVSLSAVLADVLHWRAVFAVMALASVLLWLLVARLDVPRKAVADVSTSPLSAFRVAGVKPVLVAVAAFMAAFYGTYAFLGTHMTATLGYGTAVAGVASLAYGIGFGVVAPLDKLIDRFGAVRAAPVVFGALTLVYVLMSALGQSGTAVLVVCLLWGGINHLGLNIMVGQLSALSVSQRSAILGLYSTTTYVAMFAGTALFKEAYSVIGFQGIALLSAACVLPAVAGAVWRLRRPVLRPAE